MSPEQKEYLKKLKRKKYIILGIQTLLIISFLGLWELLVNKEIISAFIYSSPSRIILTLKELIQNNNILIHILVTLKEVIIAFIIGISGGFLIALLLYEFKMLAKIIDPFLTMLNSLPKVALGPLIIIIFWC